jgi:hypothetical protein|tara:strand:- start:560 stop:775 length:216 start_codon:yes stop_codon:yes gene_type:complete
MRRYKITPLNDVFHVEVWDDYDNYVGVCEDNVISASKFILDYWDKSKENQEKNLLLNKAIKECIELDKKLT